MSLNNDKLDEKTTITNLNGDIYEGFIKDGKFNGKGKITYKLGHIYEGNFVNNKKQGEGIFKFANGTIYEGNFENDQLTGQGKLTNLSGITIEGIFKNGILNGEGTYSKNGKVRRGYFENSVFSKTPSKSSSKSNPGKQMNLSELNEIIKVFNTASGDLEFARDFFVENDENVPFIIRSLDGSFMGYAVDWHWQDVSVDEKFFVECSDETPENIDENDYKRYVKSDGKRFLKIQFPNNDVKFVIVPQWYKNDIHPPGTKYFDLVKAGTIFKFMSERVETPPPQHNEIENVFSSSELGAANCKQNVVNDIYELREMTLDQLNSIQFTMGGKKNKKHSRKSKKQSRKSKKQSRKSKKYNSKSKKYNRKK